MDSDDRIFTIKEDGVYEAPDGSRFQYRKGHVLGAEGADLKRVGDFPDPVDPRTGEAVKAEPVKAENKSAPAPSNKAAK